MTGARLVFAHYWAGINLWTVIDSHVLRRNGKQMELDISTAMAANELGLLGDRVVATTARLVMSIFPDPDTPVATVEVSEEEQEVHFTISKVEFSCNGKPLIDPTERKIASYLFYFGSGELTTRTELHDEGRLVCVDHIRSAPEGSESPIVGSHLSSMYSTRYILATKEADGTVARFGHAPDPNIARLIPSDYWDTNDRVLQLSVLHQQPNSATLPQTRGTAHPHVSA